MTTDLFSVAISFAFSRVLYECNYTVCSLLNPTSSLSIMHARFIHAEVEVVLQSCEGLSISFSPLLFRYSSSDPQPKTKNVHQASILVGPWTPIFFPSNPWTCQELCSASHPIISKFHVQNQYSPWGVKLYYMLHSPFLASSLLPDADPADFHLLVKTLMHLNSFLNYILLSFSFFFFFQRIGLKHPSQPLLEVEHFWLLWGEMILGWEEWN